MYFSIEKRLPKLLCAVAVLMLMSAALSAQTAKKAADKKTKPTAAKTSAAKNSPVQPPKKATATKQAKTDQPPTKADKNSKSKTAAAKKSDDAKKADKPMTVDKKRLAAERAQRAQAERQRAAEAEALRRRQILAEQQRRAEIAREAQLRQIAFERGLHTETVANISQDNIEGEDLQIRAAAVNALGSHAGTVLVMEAQTGKVLSIVNQDWAIRHSFKPCSTIKLVTAVAGINESVIGDDGKIRDRRFPMGLDDALAFSNNSYFQTVGSGLGNQKMIAYAQMLGLGQPTGINAGGETGGRIAFGNNNARIYSHGDDFEVTPLQLGVVVSALSNGGRMLVPHIPKTSVERTNYLGAMRYQLTLPNNNFRNVLPGMVGAASYGTARRGMDQTLSVAGKTGSCIADGSWVGLFASVAPVQNPKYAVVVITRGQGERGRVAAGIAASIYQTLRPRLLENSDRNLAAVPVDLKPQSKINAQTSAKIDVAEGVESEDNDAAKPATKAVGKKGEVAESFPSVVIKVRKSEEVTRPRVVSNK